MQNSPHVICVGFNGFFMYPLVVIFAIALFKKDRKVFDYTLSLAAIGWLISFYHNYIYYKAINATACRIGESCITPYVHEFGYITIPMMAFTAFSLVVVLALINRHYMSKKQ